MQEKIKRRSKKVLLLCHCYPGAAGAIVDHVCAFEKYSSNQYFVLSNLGDLPDWLDLSRFDALIFHYSLVACYDNFISPAGRKRIREFQGFKAAFVQDDYRWIDDTVNALSYMGFHALFPLTGPEIIDIVYSPEKLPNVRKETVLAGYVPEELVGLPVRSYKERNIDVGYRARKLPAWMGSHTLQKWQIAERFLKDASRYRLNVDISCREEDRIYGNNWIIFVTNCKATLGTESGASICDFTGNIQRNVEAHLSKYPDTDFDTLRDMYFKDEDCKIMMNVISPRCFEAAALRTLMILYEGHYSGVLQPWRHYVPLKRDHSNMDEVVRILSSPEEAQKIIDQAYEEVAKNDKNSYRAMVELVDRVMEEEWSASMNIGHNSFTKEEFEWHKKHYPKGIDHALNQQSEPALFFPGNAVERLPDEGVRLTDSATIGFFDIVFDSRKDVSEVAIRWDVNLPVAPYAVEIQGVREGQVTETHKLTHPQQEVFQLIRLTPRMHKVDSLRLLVNCKFENQPVSALTTSVLVRDSKHSRRWVRHTKTKIQYLLSRYWAVTPEEIRKIIRPAAHFVRRTLKHIQD